MFRAQELNVRAEVERLQRMLGGLAQLWHSEEVREIAGRLAGQCELLQNKVDLLARASGDYSPNCQMRNVGHSEPG